MISCAVNTTSTVCSNASTSNVSSSRRYLSKLMLARLHAELSKWTYSLQGLLALMRPVFDAVCQRLIVVSNCIPGSAHSHADWLICCMRSRARTLFSVSPVVTDLSSQSRSSTTACMNVSVTRTELLAFWYWI